MEKKAFSNRASMDQNNVIMEEEMVVEQSPSPRQEKPQVISGEDDLEEESSHYVGEFAEHAQNVNRLLKGSSPLIEYQMPQN